MAGKKPTGKITKSGADYAKSKGWSKTGRSDKVKGLVDADVSALIRIENDNTAQIESAINKAIASALEKIGQAAVGYAKKLCPVKTGRLRNSITHSLDADGKQVSIGTNVEYAKEVELGLHGKKAQPYLRPAVSDHENQWRKILTKAMKDGG